MENEITAHRAGKVTALNVRGRIDRQRRRDGGYRVVEP